MTTSSSTNNDEEVNPYLAMRQAKIARNEARLRELGLLRKPPRSSPQQPVKVVRGKKKTPAKQVKTGPLRRSSRVRSYPTSSLAGNEPTRTPQNESTEADLPQEKVNKFPRKVYRAEIQAEPIIEQMVEVPCNSARAMNLQIHKLLYGSNNSEEGFLGKRMSDSGKMHVMMESARVAVEGYEGETVSFNKYSGVQEWGGGVVFLWINLNAPNSDVINEFYQNGKQVVWFGGSRMHSGTPIIKKLIQVGSQPDLSHSPSSAIILWCRQYVQEKRSFTPYTCLGRLQLVSVEPDSSPVPFVWELLDYEALVNHTDGFVKANFDSIRAV